MKVYQHIIIIVALVLFTILFYQYGFGSISFLLAAIYLGITFIKEVKRYMKSKEV